MILSSFSCMYFYGLGQGVEGPIFRGEAIVV
jgi:hypothetical protein